MLDNDELKKISELLSISDLIHMLLQKEFVTNTSAEGVRYITVPESLVKTTLDDNNSIR